MAIIERPDYIEQVVRHLDKGLIIVLVGQRRAGKSYVLKMLREKISKEENSNIIFIDKEKREFDSIKDYHNLNDFIYSRFEKTNT